MIHLRALAALLLFATLAACSSAKTAPEARAKSAAAQTAADESASTDPAVLTRTAAVARSKQIMHVGYGLWFRVSAEGSEFEGRVTANFEVRKKGKEIAPMLAVDFDGGSLSKTELNGTLLTVTRDDKAPALAKAPASGTAFYNGHQLFIAASDLRVGPNRLLITFSHPYSGSSHGLHRFKDSSDGETYLYTDFEPYFAHQVFPCFDQPDLKARFELTVEAPKPWTVIANSLEKEVTGVSGLNSWTFPPTPPLSTYLFAMDMGPFASWKSSARIFRSAPSDAQKVESNAKANAQAAQAQAKDDDDDDDSPAGEEGLPIRLFARKSVAKYVDSAEWLDITAKGLKFYSDLFDYPLPYGKYDQILLPEFASEAMENAGAVSVSDDWVFRSKETTDRHRSRANLILHEAAHHWFGDLVTMKWWNGLWLNESFAELMAAWSVDQATSYKGSWQAFNVEKQSAYEADQLVTTHAIDTHVPDTDQAFANFDDITYGKGAAALRQLIFFIGEDDFKDGIQRYFAKYATKNTTISEFIKTLAEASARDLKSWEQLWLQTPGLNTVRADWACEAPGGTQTGGAANAAAASAQANASANAPAANLRISKFTLIQGNAEMNKVLRPHRMEIALLKSASTKTPRPEDLIQVSYGPAAETPVPQAIGLPCPALVILNHGDYDYVKVLVDPVTLAAVRENLGKLPDPLLRQMFWFGLWDKVEDGSLRAQDFADVAMKHLPAETDAQVIHRVLNRLADPTGSRPSVLKYLDGKTRDTYQAQIEEFTRKNLVAARGGSDQQLVWFFAFLDALHSPEQTTWAHRLLEGKAHVHGFKVDQERRWELIEALARNGAPDAKDLITQELLKDPSDEGRRAAISSEVSLPDAAIKKKWLSLMLDFLEKGSPGASSPDLRNAMMRFHWLGQEQLGIDEAEAFFNEVPKLGAEKDEEFRSVFADSMFPSAVCQKSIVDRTTQVLDANPRLPASVLRSLLINRQQTERCLKAREKSAGPA